MHWVLLSVHRCGTTSFPGTMNVLLCKLGRVTIFLENATQQRRCSTRCIKSLRFHDEGQGYIRCYMKFKRLHDFTRYSILACQSGYMKANRPTSVHFSRRTPRNGIETADKDDAWWPEANSFPSQMLVGSFLGGYPLSCELTAFIESYVRKYPFHASVAFFVGREQRKWVSVKLIKYTG